MACSSARRAARACSSLAILARDTTAVAYNLLESAEAEVEASDADATRRDVDAMAAIATGRRSACAATRESMLTVMVRRVVLVETDTIYRNWPFERKSDGSILTEDITPKTMPLDTYLIVNA